MLSVITSVIGLTLSVGVAIHEWLYRQDHPYSSGVSGVLIALSLAVAAGCLAALSLALSRIRDDKS